MAKLRLNKSEELRDKLISQSQKKIKKMYKELSDEISKKIQSYNLAKDSATKSLQLLRLQQLQKELQRILQSKNSDLEEMITSNVDEISNSVQDEMNDFLKKINFGYGFGHIPKDVVESVISGSVYNKVNYLSKRIWDISKKELDDINSIIAKGIADGSTTYEIGKVLEKYVDPNAAKLWDWSKVYPGTNKKIDYNAQRLSRTLIQHAFQQSFERAGENNPFITEYIWLSALAHGRTCQVCRDRHMQHFKKNELPMDHPNGLCTWAYVTEDLRSVAKKINEWQNAPKGTYPEIDRFAESLEYLYKDII